MLDRATVFAITQSEITAEDLMRELKIPKLRAYDLLYLMVQERVLTAPEDESGKFRVRLSESEWRRTTEYSATFDPMFNDALSAVFRERKINAVALSRHMGIDLRRANRLLAEMYGRGVLNSEVISQLSGKAIPA
jgi:hypothetical protein